MKTVVRRYLKEQLWLFEAWAERGPACRGWWPGDEEARKDYEDVRDWLRWMVGSNRKKRK